MALETTVAAPPDDPREYFTGERYKALRLLWRRTSLKSVRSCQHHSVMPDGNVKVLVTPTPSGPRVGFSGLATCGSVWSCPVCSHKIASRRSEEIAAAIRRWQSMGGRVAMVTLTMRHKRGQRLTDLWDALSKAWGAVTIGGWAEDQEKYGTPIPRLVTHGSRKGQVVTENRIGWLRAAEATHPIVNGWHLHIHSLLFLKGDPDLDGLSKSMFHRWRERLITDGMSAPIASRGGLDAKWIDGRRVDGKGEVVYVDGANGVPIAEYLVKNTYDGALRAGFEAARGGHKRAGGKTPFQMLANVCENLDNADDPLAQKIAEADLARWYEWEEASKGRRQITWSRGFRDFLALEDELTDDEIAAEDGTTDETAIADIMSAKVWAVARRDIPLVRRNALRWYLDEYLPALEEFPPWLEQWRKSWFTERLDRQIAKPANESFARLELSSTQTVRSLSDDCCSGCGEKLDVLLNNAGHNYRHLGC